jgi:hypothetical protein
VPKPDHSGRESLSGGIWGSTFCGGGSSKRTLRGAQRPVVPCLSFSKSKQLSLFGPIDGYLERQSHQLLRRELRWVLAIDDGSDDIGCERRKAQKARQVADGKSLVAGYSRHSQIGVLHQPSLKVMRSSDDPEQSGIGCRLVIGVLDEHSHLTAYALQSGLYRQH